MLKEYLYFIQSLLTCLSNSARVINFELSAKVLYPYNFGKPVFSNADGINFTETFSSGLMINYSIEYPGLMKS